MKKKKQKRSRVPTGGVGRPIHKVPKLFTGVKKPIDKVPTLV